MLQSKKFLSKFEIIAKATNFGYEKFIPDFFPKTKLCCALQNHLFYALQCLLVSEMKASAIKKKVSREKEIKISRTARQRNNFNCEIIKHDYNFLVFLGL
jgi:hypothetical protein